jgi:adenylylsulfate kinase-like enzyme
MGAAARDARTSERTQPAGVVVWLTGEEGEVTSDFAESLRREFVRRGYLCSTLDGVVVERNIVPPPANDGPDGRRAFHETLARLAAMLCDQGQVVVVAAMDGDASFRKTARDLAAQFVDVAVEPHDDVPSSAKNLRLPGFDLDLERARRPELVARDPRDHASVNRIVSHVGRYVY